MLLRRLPLVAAACAAIACAAQRPPAEPAVPKRAHASAASAPGNPQSTPPAKGTRHASAPGAPSAPSAPPAPPALAHFTDLPVPGHQPARLWVPAGRDARPLLVVSHGAGGHASWHCELWRGITRARGFVLCPRGTRINPHTDSGYFFKDDPALEREVLAAVQAVRATYPRVDPGPAVYAGYSQGAIMGALMAHRHPDLFPRLVLVEDSHDWDIPTAHH